MNAHNFSYGAPINHIQQPLTLDALRGYAPSAFAAEAHESRSARYSYIPTVEVITAMMKEGFQPFKATQSRSRIAGKTEFTKHMIRFRHPDYSVNLKVGDSVPEIVLINSHDGTSAYKLSAGLFRLVCSNGLMVADSTVASLSVYHKGNIVQDVLEGSFEIIGQSEKALEKVGEWQGLTLSAGEQNAFAEAAHVLRFANSDGKIETSITAAQLLIPRRAEDADVNNRRQAAPDMWRTLNTVQENVIKGGLQNIARDANGRHIRRVTTREVKGIDQDQKLNKAMWILAERMAELKHVAA
jgi:hypothetical protein